MNSETDIVVSVGWFVGVAAGLAGVLMLSWGIQVGDDSLVQVGAGIVILSMIGILVVRSMTRTAHTLG
jgi:drug/metabolite transporter (DMT)-like permease